MMVDEYRNKIFKELGIAPWEMIPNGIPNYPWKEAEERFEKGIVKHIAANTKKSPVYIVITCGENITKNIEDNLYLTGLTYYYSDEKTDNIAMLKRNFELVYALDYLDKYFVKDMTESLVKRFNLNYAVPMAKLYEHYKLSGDKDKAEYYKGFILQIVAHSEVEQEWNDYFSKN